MDNQSRLLRDIQNESSSFSTNFSQYPPQINTRMVNLNAYELRELILKNAIDVVQKYSNSNSLNVVVDEIMKTAEKFYNFVENKHK